MELLNLSASLGIAVCEFPLTTGLADYLLFISNGKKLLMNGRKTVRRIEQAHPSDGER